MEEVIVKAEEFALSEIKRYGFPSRMNFDTSNEKGLQLAKEYDADPFIVQIGTRLMDIKLGEAISKGKPGEHVKMSVDATIDFLSQFDLPEDVRKKILNCVEGHHGTKKWTCKEAEVCANADCYRFLLIRNWLAFLNSLGADKSSFEHDLKFAEDKANEKWKILSLGFCKKELEPYYNMINKIIKKARIS